MSMQTRHSIWIEPPPTVCGKINRLRMELGIAEGGVYPALPPWILLAAPPFTPGYNSGPDQTLPFWLPREQSVADRIIRRDKSSSLFESPRLSCTYPEWGIEKQESVLMGELWGVGFQLEGGRIPDLRKYNGSTIELPLLDLTRGFLPLFSIEGIVINDEDGDILADMKFRRSSIHLIKSLSDGSPRAGFEWESILQFDLVQNRDKQV